MIREKTWDELAEKWNDYRQKPVQEVVDFLSHKVGRVLDLGCGAGRNLIKQKNTEFYCVDFSEKMLKYAKEKSKREKIKAKFFKSEVEKLSFKDNFFDSAIFISVLHCIKGEENRKKALQELFRTLKKHGEAIISVWDKSKSKNKKVESLNAREGIINWKKDGKKYKRYYYFYDEKELLKLLRYIGFKIIKREIKGEDKRHSKNNIIVYVKK